MRSNDIVLFHSKYSRFFSYINAKPPNRDTLTVTKQQLTVSSRQFFLVDSYAVDGRQPRNFIGFGNQGCEAINGNSIWLLINNAYSDE